VAGKPAKPSDWKTAPMPTQSKTIPFVQEYTSNEFNLISAGLIPVEMEDRWFIYYEAPWLYLNRSWTGFCIYMVRFEAFVDGMSAVTAIANRDPSQYSELDDSKDADFLARLLDRVIRGIA
jgi:hypothetical protein